MELNTSPAKFGRQRKFVIILLAILLPLIAFLVWSFTVGNEGDKNGKQLANKGFNTALPEAYLKDQKPLDKLSYYNKAALDSGKLKEQIKSDPYYIREDSEAGNFPDMNAISQVKYSRRNSRLSTSPGRQHAGTDPYEAEVYSKLEKLNTVLNRTSSESATKEPGHPPYSRTSNASVSSADIDRMEQMIHMMSEKDGEDLELQQLNGMLEKILQIQHPERLKEKMADTSQKRNGNVFAVSAKRGDSPVSLIGKVKAGNMNDSANNHFAALSNSFYALDDETVSNSKANAVEAVVHQTQTIVNGSTVKLRLLNDVVTNGAEIPEDNFVFGTASLNGERLFIKINSIRYLNSLFPVTLSTYDMDGMEGIYIPGAISRDVAKQSVNHTMQDVGFNSLDPSIAVQAASAGIEAAKTLVNKKVKLTKVTVKAGYRVLLYDENQKLNN